MGAFRTSSSSTVRPQIRPWQMPSPARVESLSERRLDDAVAVATARSAPQLTSSHRQTVVSSVNHVVQPGRTWCAAWIRWANSRYTVRAFDERRNAASPGEPPAAQRPATAPSASASSTPPIPVISPAAYTAGRLVRCSVSTATNPSPSSAQPTATASSRRGVNSWLTQTASAGTRSSVPGIGRHSRSSLAMVTAMTRSVPWACTTALPVR